ncbi:MAG: hypothetical protein A6F72_02095 [Cycloclasticus sp. symbiont of Poecilosclerida sp. N]|nr:MAG: hypothetical protein A6F72_02095 [Cycloclasticus sp. symbiont of Poecilosclerida sp. N]
MLMKTKRKGISQFAFMMFVLSIVAVLLGVGVFSWLIAGEMASTCSGGRQPISKDYREGVLIKDNATVFMH